MDYQLNGKTALITGSTAGIGMAIAGMLAKEGCRVLINGRTENRILEAETKIKREVPEASIGHYLHDFNNSILPSVDEHVDILVNNAGIFTSRSFEETNDLQWQEMFEVNVMSGVRLSRLLLPEMIQKDWGRIIFISSECAELAPADLIAYSATKAALHAVARGLANAAFGTGVTVNTVMPGSTLTEGARSFLEDKAEKEGLSTLEIEQDFFRKERPFSLLGRFASTEEVAYAVAFLASPLSSALNGSILKAEGGSTMGI